MVVHSIVVGSRFLSLPSVSSYSVINLYPFKQSLVFCTMEGKLILNAFFFGEKKEERQRKLLKLLVKLSINISGTRMQTGRGDGNGYIF